ELFLRRPKTSASPFAKGPTHFASWDEVRENTDDGEAQSATQLLATYEDMLPADLASALLDLPEQRMLEVAGELSDDRLADVLEERPGERQVEIFDQREDLRAADVHYQRQAGYAAYLLARSRE